jgi:hypothetical protein
MVAIIIYAVILIVCLCAIFLQEALSSKQDSISRWIDNADFEEEQEHDDSGYDWRDNIKGYKKDEEDNKKVGQD